MPNGNGNRMKPSAVVVTVMGTVLALGAAALIGVSSAGLNKATKAERDVVVHDGNPGAHAMLQERIDGNHRIIQQKIETLDDKLDLVLKAVEK